MRRRHFLAGLTSVGVLGGAGAVATGNAPAALGSGSGSKSENRNESDGVEPVDPVTVKTVDAPGSRDGEVTIPADGQATFVDFFGTWCPPCADQMPALGEAYDRVGEEVLFASVTTEDVGGSVSESDIADWWRKYNGDWLVAADVTAELAAKLNVGGYPTAVALDSDGRIAWSESGVHTADELVDGIETALPR